MHDAEPPGPDLPPPDEPITGDAYTYRWPMGAEKVELDDGCPYFYGYFDHRDVEIAERAFPGRRAVIEPHNPDETRWGNLKIFPAPAGRQGVRPLRSAEDLIQPGMFDSDEQLDEYLASCAPSVGRQPAMHEQELPCDWREREHTAVKRLFEAVGRPPTEAELTKVQEIVDAAEQTDPSPIHKQLRAQLSEPPYVDGSPWRDDRVQLVDPNTQQVVCSLAYHDAVVLAFEIEQTAARVMAGQWLRETLDQHRER